MFNKCNNGIRTLTQVHATLCYLLATSLNMSGISEILKKPSDESCPRISYRGGTGRGWNHSCLSSYDTFFIICGISHETAWTKTKVRRLWKGIFMVWLWNPCSCVFLQDPYFWKRDIPAREHVGNKSSGMGLSSHKKCNLIGPFTYIGKVYWLAGEMKL